MTLSEAKYQVFLVLAALTRARIDRANSTFRHFPAGDGNADKKLFPDFRIRCPEVPWSLAEKKSCGAAVCPLKAETRNQGSVACSDRQQWFPHTGAQGVWRRVDDDF